MNKPVNIRIPPGARIANYLHWQMSLDELNADLVSIELRNGYFVNVGWYPENDANGEFVARVFSGFDELHTSSAHSVADVIDRLQDLADYFDRGQATKVSRSSGAQGAPDVIQVC